jgi:serine/threonine protein kinase
VTWLSDRAIDRLREAAAWPELDDRYTVTGVAGRGGMGTVYVARDRVLDREVAVKVLDLTDQKGARVARLTREAHILARLDHPGIVPVHDAVRMRKGYGLEDAGEQVETQRLRRLAGSFGEVFVMDWGVAQDGAADLEPAVVGTPGFMPPEQAGARAVDARADVFALGAVLSQMIGATAPPPLAAVAAKAQHADPQARYQTVDELAADVARFRNQERVSAYRESLVERGLRVYRRYELPILLLLAYIVMRFVLLVAGGV